MIMCMQRQIHARAHAYRGVRVCVCVCDYVRDPGQLIGSTSQNHISPQAGWTRHLTLAGGCSRSADNNEGRLQRWLHRFVDGYKGNA